ncbi:hypothetical protein LVY74_03435 [Acinetobacter sp. ME22]|uniref:hypothetical protein n=1 Tax=Acinetobacter sp. ME22 TaxID=2904802 RepID=UPI001EDA9DC6|nr:hypothetical protein [Acinetobacter sp. ME22]MCG2572613.1 hypothetical protein [Acinetobacter sp. ME22]
MSSEILHAFWMCLVIALAATSISITITQTELFVPVQHWMQRCHRLLGYLFQCFYCMSHWVVIVMVLIYQPILIHSQFIWIDLMVSIFVCITLTAWMCGAVFQVFVLAIRKKQKQFEFQNLISK